MATSLLEDLRDHIRDAANTALPGLRWKLHQFTDADLTGSAPVLLIKRSGTGGYDDEVVQSIDADIVAIVGEDQVKAGEDLMHALRAFLKSEAGYLPAERASTAFGYVVFGPLLGPSRLQNGRQRYAFVVRCFTENQ